MEWLEYCDQMVQAGNAGNDQTISFIALAFVVLVLLFGGNK